ncbi:hypothetical protein GCM10009624_33530 [Gordonia sinesedis]
MRDVAGGSGPREVLLSGEGDEVLELTKQHASLEHGDALDKTWRNRITDLCRARSTDRVPPAACGPHPNRRSAHAGGVDRDRIGTPERRSSTASIYSTYQSTEFSYWTDRFGADRTSGDRQVVILDVRAAICGVGAAGRSGLRRTSPRKLPSEYVDTVPRPRSQCKTGNAGVVTCEARAVAPDPSDTRRTNHRGLTVHSRVVTHRPPTLEHPDRVFPIAKAEYR